MLARRPPLTIAAIALTIGALTAGCASDQDAEPTIASVDFTPRLVVLARDDALAVEPGPRDDGVVLDPPSVPAGSVIEVRNAGNEDHRITAGTTIDTGVMRPGDSTTVVMATAGDVVLRDVDSGDTLVITVTARTDGR